MSIFEEKLSAMRKNSRPLYGMKTVTKEASTEKVEAVKIAETKLAGKKKKPVKKIAVELETAVMLDDSRNNKEA